MARVTQRMVAEAAGVSLTTVSLALRDEARLPSATRRRIQLLAEEMGYRPDPQLAAGMARLRGHRQGGGAGAVLFLIHFQPMEEMLVWAGVRRVVEGLETRADRLGYRLESHHAGTGEAATRRLLRAMRQRGIPGAISLGAVWLEAVDVLRSVVERWPVLRAGGAIPGLPIHAAESDHFRGTRLAMQTVLARGYQRPGLVTNRAFDDSMNRALTGAFWAEAARLPPADRIEPFLRSDFAPGDTSELLSWWRRRRPDCILTNKKHFSLSQWSEWNPLPHPVPMIQLGLTEETPDWPGVTYPGEAVGHTAVDMVVAQIHRGESGMPSFQKISLTAGHWVGELPPPA